MQLLTRCCSEELRPPVATVMERLMFVSKPPLRSGYSTPQIVHVLEPRTRQYFQAGGLH